MANLPKRLQPAWRAKLQPAYHQPTDAATQATLHRLQGGITQAKEVLVA